MMQVCQHVDPKEDGISVCDFCANPMHPMAKMFISPLKDNISKLIVVPTESNSEIVAAFVRAG